MSGSRVRAVPLSLALVLACRAPADDDDTASAASDGGSTDGGTPVDGAVLLTDANNYRFEGVLDGPSFPLAEYADSSISWASLTEDLQCHPLDPVADIDNVSLMVFPLLSEEEVEEGLSTDTLEQVDIAVYLSNEPGEGTEVNLSEMTFFGTDAHIQDEFAEGSGAWLMVFTTGTTVGVGSRMIAFLTPTAGESATHAEVRDGCSVLDVDVSIADATAVSIPTAGPWAFDWSGLTTTAQGQPFDPLAVTEIMVARYDDLGIAELEADFLDLELLADGLWTQPHPSGTSTELADLVDAGGAPFPGFTAGGTWLLALRCGTCPNPAPLFLAVLVPVD